MAAVDYFLKIKGIEGESTDSKHKGEMELESWSWGEANVASVTSSGGAGTGRVSMQDFSFVKKMDKSSPVLMKYCATGEHPAEAVLICRKAGKEQQEFLKITFTNCFITSYQISGGGDSPVESFTMAYEKIEMGYKEQKPDGTLGGEIKASYNLKENKAA